MTEARENDIKKPFLNQDDENKIKGSGPIADCL